MPEPTTGCAFASASTRPAVVAAAIRTPGAANCASQPAWFCLRAYGLYVRQLAGRSVSAASLVKEAGGLEQLPTEALGWLLPVLVGEQRQAARQVLLNRMDETASGVSFEQTLGSPERTQAVVLEAMLGDQDVAPGEGYELTALQRLFLFTRSDTIYAGSNQIQRNIIGERALGLPKEPSL